MRIVSIRTLVGEPGSVVSIVCRTCERKGKPSPHIVVWILKDNTPLIARKCRHHDSEEIEKMVRGI